MKVVVFKLLNAIQFTESLSSRITAQQSVPHDHRDNALASVLRTPYHLLHFGYVSPNTTLKFEQGLNVHRSYLERNWLGDFSAPKQSPHPPQRQSTQTVGRLEVSHIDGKSNCFAEYTQSILGSTRCRLTGERALGINLGRPSIC